jgi:tripartite-type tricarboxylate transporter receptor subunit TctC
VVSTLSDAFQKGIEADAFKKFAQDQGLVARYQSPAELRARTEKDYILYGEMIKKLGLKAGN